MHNNVLVGTYHKTGTKWMESMFSMFCRRTGKLYFSLPENRVIVSMEPLRTEVKATTTISTNKFNVLFSDSSSFFNYSYPGIHIIRDPRDVAISGEKYHTSDHAKENEKWLVELGYYEKLSNIDTYKSRLVYEAETITKLMCSYAIENLNKENMIPIKYEDIFQDYKNDFKTLNIIKDYFSMNLYEFSIFKECYINTHIRFNTINTPDVKNGNVEQFLKLEKSTRILLTDLLEKEILALDYSVEVL